MKSLPRSHSLQMSTLWSLCATIAVVISTLGMNCVDGRATQWSITCGLGNPMEHSFGHGGINVEGKETAVDGVRICSWELIHPKYVTWYIRVEVKNVTATGLSCDSSRQLFVGEANDNSTMERLCGPMSFSKLFPSSVFIQVKGDTGGDIDDIEMDVSLEEVEYMKTCNSTYFQDEKTIRIAKTLNPDDFLFLPYNCHWKFHTKDWYNRLIIQVNSVSIMGPNYQSQGCQNNTLTVIDGWERDHDVLMETCNDNTDLTFTTTQNSALLVMMITEPSQELLSFNFSVTPFSITQCYGQVITLKASSENRFITSPGYPENYYAHLNCQWKIESEDNNEIEIVFEDLELFYDCSNDYVLVYDGPDQTSLLLAKECGENVQHKYRSSGKTFLIQFKANDYNQEKGFKLRYYTQADASSDLVADKSCRKNIVHLKATSESKFLSSVDYPSSYPPHSNCRWLIHSLDDNIEVEIVDLDLEASIQCSRDSLDIYPGNDTNVSPLASLCRDMSWEMPGTKFRSSGQYMRIDFTSDDSLQHKGFKLRYYTRAEPSPDLANVTSCRGKIVSLYSTEEIENLTSSGFPSSYPPWSDCRWQIIAEPGNVTKLDILVMDLDSHYTNANCKADFVEVFDGPSIHSTSLGKFCSKTTSLQSSGRYLTIQFQTDRMGSARGFSLNYYTPSKETDKQTTGETGPGTGTTNGPSFIITCMSTIFILVLIHS